MHAYVLECLRAVQEDDDYEARLAALLVPGGLDIDEIKALSGSDLDEFAKKMSKNTRIKAEQVGALAFDMGIPAIITTKSARILSMIKKVKGE